MRYILLCLLSMTYFSGMSQTQIWSDDFEATAGNWNLTIQTGQNDANANTWYISDEEGGVAPPGCGVNTNGNKTLYVGCQGAACAPLNPGANYYPGDNGMGGQPGVTNIQAALTTPISTVGETQLELEFDWLGVGEAGVDFAELQYSIDGGASWTTIWTQTPGPTCPTGEGQWGQETVNLPVATENQADLRFAFNWQNDNNLNGTQTISFATDNLSLTSNAGPTGGPTADFTATALTICENDCVDFTDASTGTNINAWDWSFNGANTATSNNQNPTNICWTTAGTYNVTLTVTDDNGTDDVTYQVTVQDCSNPPVADFTADTLVVCAGECIQFTDLSENDPETWNWDFGGATPPFSTEQNPIACFDTDGTYQVTLTVTNSTGVDQITIPVEVLPLPTLTAFGDTLIDIGGAAELFVVPDQPGSVFWEPSESVDCDSCELVVANPVITTTYYPSVTDMNGCVGYDTVTVYLAFEEIVAVPSAFSPNGDGENDRLNVLGIGIESIDFKIYNRYGQMVFSTNDLDEGWDGTMDGKQLNQGVFVYTLSYTLIDGTKSKISGNVKLVK
ncbi:PKD domain-containing protein [Brumimicrobium aurantiacum]|uniref:PKD domain-containing protein n=1 Tax=Brumimicrobium aurantiacum TaxID=1737063 RepID=A0A3E1EZB1_9FLAO|nr:PKD domain-containing protein [Brumimicrobium aurantiacum]RFC54886.1 PKD domain-containing protein [Brumimicrobium aurantiacum]